MLNENQIKVLHGLQEALKEASKKCIIAAGESTPNIDVAIILLTIDQAVDYVLLEDQKQ